MKPREMTVDATSGMIKFSSPWSFTETVERIQAAFSARNIKLFACIDQTAAAVAVGLTLRPTTLFIFGDPRKGTPLMEAHPTLAIDLPLKALVWEAGPAEVFIGLSSPEFLQKRHGLSSAPFTEIVRFFTALVDSGS